MHVCLQELLAINFLNTFFCPINDFIMKSQIILNFVHIHRWRKLRTITHKKVERKWFIRIHNWNFLLSKMQFIHQPPLAVQCILQYWRRETTVTLSQYLHYSHCLAEAALAWTASLSCSENNGCAKASAAVIRFEGSYSNIFWKQNTQFLKSDHLKYRICYFKKY